MKVKPIVERKVLLKIYIDGDDADSICKFMREAYTKNVSTKKYIPVVDQFIVDVEQALAQADHKSTKKVEDNDFTDDLTG